MISDKVGEIRFLNLENLKKLSSNKEENDKVGKLLYGHQQECLGMLISDDKQSLISCDTLNRIRISDFPNVFSIR